MYVGGVSKAFVAASKASFTPSPVMADVSQNPRACIFFASFTPSSVRTGFVPSWPTRSDLVPINTIWQQSQHQKILNLWFTFAPDLAFFISLRHFVLTLSKLSLSTRENAMITTLAFGRATIWRRWSYSCWPAVSTLLQLPSDYCCILLSFIETLTWL